MVRDGEVVARWVRLNGKEFDPARDTHLVTREDDRGRWEVLIVTDPWDVTGDYLVSATPGVDDRGRPAVNFTFDSRGATLFGRMTSANQPIAATNFYRHLGIVLDDELRTAPRLNDVITQHGQISGDFGQEEVDFIISILNAGSLPAALNKQPISEDIVSATLGQDTVRQGSLAIVVAMVVVLVFMLVYYRFSGIVACCRAAGEPGLDPGRDDYDQGRLHAAGPGGVGADRRHGGRRQRADIRTHPRGARARGGHADGDSQRFQPRDPDDRRRQPDDAHYRRRPLLDRHRPDSRVCRHLDSGHRDEHVHGHLLLADCVRHRRAEALDRRAEDGCIFRQTNFNFLDRRYVAGAVSMAAIVLGLVAVVGRGKGLLDIDFTGGTSVTILLQEDQPMDIADVRREVTDQEGLEDVAVVGVGGENLQYKINTLNLDIDEVEQRLQEMFGDRMQMNSLTLVNCSRRSGGRSGHGAGRPPGPATGDEGAAEA